jgi:two-component system chemotaxis sensor kinase CheA
MDDLLREFLTESTESLATLDQELVKLERNPNEPSLLGNIFRLVHTIKGTCGFLGLPRLETVAHAGENVLGKLRDGALEVSPTAVSLILESLDRIKTLLAALEETGKEPDGNDDELKARLNAFAEGKSSAAAAPKAAAAEPVPNPAPAPVAPISPAAAAPKVEVTPVVEAPTPEPQAEAAPAPVAAVKPAADNKAEVKESFVAAQTIRVNVEVLENLMTMVSELVLTRNQLLQILRSQKESEFSAPLQRLNHVTSELQEGVMKTRMQPIGNAWAKLPRLVRDLSHELGKKIELVMLGADTELDRQVLELIKDPLTHMVRNSADHGLEGITERKQAGKPETGKITLNAFHEGGHIIIEISDDGRGLPLGKIKQKIIANKLASEAELAQLSDQQIAQYIFRAGFSTATKVTNVSGRGVGMDVVKTNIEKIGGTTELRSTPGRGTAFVVKIPLTLAIVSALVVECGGERFAMPQIAVLELVRAAQGSEHTIERIKGVPFLRLRNRLLPLVHLKSLLKLGEPTDDAETFIVVTQVGTSTFGIMVDRVFDTEEIVVKPVAPILRDISIFSGNTILGDGSVIMILDPNGIAAAAGERSSEGASADATTQQVSRGEERTSLLVFRAGGETPRAVPLSLVARLEEVEAHTIERSDGRPVVQYRGKLMPLIMVDAAQQIRTEGRQPILVFADKNHSMGLVVDEIVDIVEDRLKMELRADRPGMIGSAVIAGKSTDVIDTAFYLTQAFADWFEAKSGAAYGETPATTIKRILLVDDSAFFRNLLTPLLSVAGYQVTTATCADEAMGFCERGEEFDAIISDIEMPGMDGFKFAETVRSNGRWQQTPMLALTAFTTPKDFERGRKAGFSDFIAKHDRDALLNSLSQSIANATRAA